MSFRQHLKSRWPWFIAGALSLVVAGVLGGIAFMYSGVYNVATSTDHFSVVYWALEKGMRASVRNHAAEVEAPDLDDPALIPVGVRCFQDHCVQCHGGPGISPDEQGKSLQPVPSSLAQAARDWPAEELYWVMKHGIRMAGMPAWEYFVAERDMWATTAFLKHKLPHVTREQYQELLEGAASSKCSQPAERRSADAARGLLTVRQYGCHGCHQIPGVTGSQVYVGPPLTHFAQRQYVGGSLPRTRENVIRWLREPESINPRTLMPNLGITEQHADDIAAYLETLE